MSFKIVTCSLNDICAMVVNTFQIPFKQFQHQNTAWHIKRNVSLAVLRLMSCYVLLFRKG